MKTSLDVVDVLWKKLDGSSLKDEISGSIYKHRRPVSSELEDIVVGSLPVTAQQLQFGLGNVNIHAPNKTIKVNDAVDNTQPDHERLKELAGMAVAILKEGIDGAITFEVQQQVLIYDEVTNEWYINIRINIFSLNLSNA